MSKPVHPILVHFPIALLVTSFLSDAAYFLTSWPSLRHAGFWMLAVATFTGALTVLAGLFDMRRASLADEVHDRVHRHMWVGVGLYVAIASLTAWRWTFHADGGKFLPMIYLDAAFLAVVLAAFQGWLGGELVYRYGVFVALPDKAPRAETGKSAHSHEHSS